MEINLNGLGDFKIDVISPRNDKFTIDASKDIGGGEDGFRPMELILAGLAGCSSFDVIHILKKGRANIEAFDVKVTAKRRDEIPKVFTDIHVHFAVKGDFSEDKLKRAIDLSVEKYCSVSAMLEKAANITTSYSFNEEG